MSKILRFGTPSFASQTVTSSPTGIVHFYLSATAPFCTLRATLSLPKGYLKFVGEGFPLPQTTASHSLHSCHRNLISICRGRFYIRPKTNASHISNTGVHRTPLQVHGDVSSALYLRQTYTRRIYITLFLAQNGGSKPPPYK